MEEIGEDLQGLEVEDEETADGIMESIEKNSNALREQTDTIVDAANAATSTVVGVEKKVVLF